jgi:phage host-nuclease inhibitor protein Gam
MKRIKSKLTPSLTRDQVLDLVADIRQCTIREIQLQADRDEAVKKVDDRFSSELDELAVLKKEKFDQVKAWAIANPSEFIESRSIFTVHGDFGFRLGQPTFKYLRGFDEATVLDTLLSRGLAEYVRTVQEVNKAAIIAARDTIGAEALTRLGIEIKQTNTFFINPKIETDQPQPQSAAA